MSSHDRPQSGIVTPSADDLTEMNDDDLEAVVGGGPPSAGIPGALTPDVTLDDPGIVGIAL